MQITLPTKINNAINLLLRSGFEAYAVGGCVRDLIMGKSPLDYDITTNALPEETEKVFSEYKIIETGIKHGTVTVLFDGLPLEITTYRVDGEYKDNRHPEKVDFSRKLKDDLSRRDFTINTLCYNEKDGLVDLFDGVKDIENGIIRTVGDADKRFNEDALRIMRAIRFSSVLGFKIEEKTSGSIYKNRMLLNNISVERLREEFSKLITGKNAHKVISEYHEVIEVFIPELSSLIGCKQNTPYHKYDVFEHTLYALDAVDNERNLKLVMFFHDFGKPFMKTTDEYGTDHFKGHAAKSKVISYDILKKLRFDNKTVNEVSFLVGIHDMKSAKDKISAKKMIREIGKENYLNLIKIKRADNRAKSNPHSIDEKLENMLSFYKEITDNCECCTLKQLSVNGNDLKEAGFADGIKIHSVLEKLLDNVIEDNAENKKEILIKEAKKLL